ncbi:MAG: hypothetical protein IJW01_00800 [Paludibacteraceae bacterium]|nr:hypothetical protein [Paludibacteraceae bacterium]
MKNRKRIIVVLLCFVAVLTTISAQNTFMGSDGSNGYSYVDLGLPSGLKWATCNVGATKPEEIGYFFAWGEVEPKEDYSLGNYKWYNASDSIYTKYYTDSNKVVLDKEDDAAAVNMGGYWRMPTKEEFEELISCCKWRAKKKGFKVIGPNGNSIFFPFYYFSDYGYRCGIYWTSSLHSLYASDSSVLNIALQPPPYAFKSFFCIREKRHTGNLVRGVYD